MTGVTKERLLAGVKRRETITVSGVDGDLVIRPLSVEEWAEIEGDVFKFQTRVRGTSADTEVNVGDTIRQARSAMLKVVALGLVPGEGETAWTIEEVRQLPAGVVDEIANAVMELSGVSLSKPVFSSFRGK